MAFLASIGIGLFLFLQSDNSINITEALQTDSVLEAEGGEEASAEPEPPKPADTGDIGPQAKLKNPPKTIKAVYVTSWSAGNEKKLSYLIDLVKNTELNAMVIDVKDYSGYITYNTELEKLYEYDAVELRTPRLNKLIKRLHDEGIYLIARVTIFQDPRLALARPDLALTSSSTGETWTDYKGIMWMDTASREVWDYNLDIVEEVLNRGFDEANLDYIRFASDGDLDDIIYPAWDEQTLKTHVVRDFFKYMRTRLPDATLSADLFGYVTLLHDGLGIGQHLEYALPYFDAIAPMVYPSHYLKNFNGYANPAEHPYGVIKYSMDVAYQRIRAYEAQRLTEREAEIDHLYAARITDSAHASTTREMIAAEVPMPRIAAMRPWLQDFDLGADYDAEKVRAQIQAAYDAATSSVMDQFADGWMLWNASNWYTKEALAPHYVNE